MIELRTKLFQELKTLHPRVYFQHATEDHAFPYVTYNFLPSFMVDAGMESMLMDVDVWDNNTNTTAIETLAQKVWEKFHHYKHVDEDIFLSIYRDSRMPEIEDDEPSIRRRKLTFQVRYMYKGGTK